MRRLNVLIAGIYLTLTPVVFGQATGWRGDGSGIWADADPPLAWDSAGKNILWGTKIGKGKSCPVVAAGKVFITAEPDKLICLDLRTGRILWTLENSFAALKLAAPEKLPETAADCGYATPTPVSDGKLVWACYGTGIVVCCDVDGGRKWVRHLDLPLLTQYGRSASPILAGDKLVLSLSHLVALDAATGKTLWEAPEARPTYGTPAIAKLGAGDVIVTPGGACVRGSDGKMLAKKLAEAQYSSPLVQGDVVYFAADPAVAIKLAGSAEGGIEPRVLWKCKDVEGTFFASPLVHEGIVYLASNEGVLYAVDAATGKLVFQKDLDIRCAHPAAGKELANVYPSPTLVGKNVLISNDAGEYLMLATGKEYKEVGRGELSKGSGASPAVAGRLLVLRNGMKLTCVAGEGK